MSGAALRLEGVTKSFPSPSGGGELEILGGVDFTLEKGESASIVGKSGSGKSTLLYIAALIESPTKGRVYHDCVDVTDLPDSKVARLRRESMGFIFQNSLLLEDFSALENVAFPLLNKGVAKKEAFARAEETLGRLGLSGRGGHRPFELSGGERQRVAIARAIAPRPALIFADEPTGALDEESAALTEDMLLSLVAEEGLSMVLVTHNTAFASRLASRWELSRKELRRVE